MLGPENQTTLEGMGGLALTHYAQGKYAHVETLYHQVLARQRHALGPSE